MSTSETPTTKNCLIQAKSLFNQIKTGSKFNPPSPYYASVNYNENLLYWPLGNTLGTIIDYLNIAIKAGSAAEQISKTEAQEFLTFVADN